jgi:predicted P-loop ATPase
VGTTNSYTYLTDSTGNRRFWPIRIKKFDIDYIRENRDQIWAEVVSREAAGESIRLHPSLYSHASMQQERRRAEDPWEVKLDEVFDREHQWRLTPDDVWGALGIGIDRRDPRANDRVLRAMTALGFRRMTVKPRDSDGNIIKDAKEKKGFGREVLEGQYALPKEEE